MFFTEVLTVGYLNFDRVSVAVFNTSLSQNFPKKLFEVFVIFAGNRDKSPSFNWVHKAPPFFQSMGRKN
jgi:hypothetical protein